MNFLFLGNFFGFILIYFSIFIIYNKKIKNKFFLYFLGARVDATWHARPRGSATRTRAAPTWRDMYLIHIIYIYYIVYGL